MSEARDILARCGLFKNMDDNWLDILDEEATVRSYPRGMVIFRQGQECPGLFVVGTGQVRIYKVAPSGKDHVLHFARQGMTFGEVAVIGQFRCPAYADALEPTNCALVPKDRFRRLLETHHDFCLQFITGLAFWVRQTVGLLEDIVLRDATARLAHYMLENANGTAGAAFKFPVKKRDLASHLNMTGEALSRTLKRLNECDLIELPDQHSVRITDAAGLRDVASGMPPSEFA